ncbi:MAG TPA: thermonuclease family protein [Methanothrix sp.]|nr:thermonuclease family protein [Methanothrix sp.]
MKLIKVFFIVPLLLLISSAGCAPDEVAGRVIHVTDGDTFDVRLDSHDDRISDEVIRVRLADLDAPEMYGERACEAGRIAGEYTRSNLMGNLVSLDIDDKNGQDDYGRWMAVCYLEDGRNFNRMLIDSGHAAKKDFRNNEFDPESWYSEEQPIEEEYSPVQSDREDGIPQADSDVMPQNEAENKSWLQLILEIIAAASS